MAELPDRDASTQWFQRYGAAAPECVDLSRPSSARVYDALLGGKDNFAVDREVVAQMTGAVPNVTEGARIIRSCLKRVVRAMVTEAGIDQFIDLGSGLPTQENVHEIARRHAPNARVAYVDNDPVVVAHGRAILARDDSAAVLTADLRDVEGVLGHPDLQGFIDLERPVGLIMCAVVQYVPDDDDPKRVIAAYRDRLASGSHLFIGSTCRLNATPTPVGAEMARILRESLGATLRSAREIEELFAGWRLVEPGLVPLSLWRPDGVLDDGFARAPDDIPESHRALIGGVARR